MAGAFKSHVYAALRTLTNGNEWFIVRCTMGQRDMTGRYAAQQPSSPTARSHAARPVARSQEPGARSQEPSAGKELRVTLGLPLYQFNLTQGSAYRVELSVYGIAKQRAVLGRAKSNGVGRGGGIYRGLFANKLGVAVINANVEKPWGNAYFCSQV